MIPGDVMEVEALIPGGSYGSAKGESGECHYEERSPEIEQFVMEEDNVDAYVISLERVGDDSCTASTQNCDDLSGCTSRGKEESVIFLNVSGTNKARKERVRADELKEQEKETVLNPRSTKMGKNQRLRPIVIVLDTHSSGKLCKKSG